jgi:hypothetical protein
MRASGPPGAGLALGSLFALGSVFAAGAFLAVVLAGFAAAFFFVSPASAVFFVAMVSLQRSRRRARSHRRQEVIPRLRGAHPDR